MNKLANTYLDAAASLLAIHLKCYKGLILDDWTSIVSNLIDAVQALNDEPSPSDPRVFRHDFTPEELAQDKKMRKPLTLADLKQQVDGAVNYGSLEREGQDLPEGCLFLIGDFEIRRRK